MTTDWCTEIESAMKRGGSPFTVDDVVARLRAGTARMWVAGRLHGSVFFYDDGSCEVGHMAGVWTDEDGGWIISRVKEFLKERGYTALPVSGRKGWVRFLQMKGLI